MCLVGKELLLVQMETPEPERYHDENINKHPKLLPPRRRDENLKMGNSFAASFMSSKTSFYKPCPLNLSSTSTSPRGLPNQLTFLSLVSRDRVALCPNLTLDPIRRREPNMNQIISLDWPI